VIRTERLILRKPGAEDLDGFIEFSADPETMRFLGGVKGPPDAWRDLAKLIGAWELGPAAMFSVVERETGAWVGRIGPWEPFGWPVREVGWGVLRRFEGRGHAFEATVAAMDFVFHTLAWGRVDHLIDDDNVRSIALAERLGSSPGEMIDMPVENGVVPIRRWGQSRGEWERRRGGLGVPAAAVD
jgi:RimJ/RimL family protein N-acetyltransferase